MICHKCKKKLAVVKKGNLLVLIDDTKNLNNNIYNNKIHKVHVCNESVRRIEQSN